MENENLVFQVRLDENAYMPQKAYKTDAGYDLKSPYNVCVYAKGSATIDTGVHILICGGYSGLICPKSGLNVSNGIISHGLIDAGYTGSICVKLYNLSDKDYHVLKGDKISQIMFLPIASPKLMERSFAAETERCDNGFGSTGK